MKQAVLTLTYGGFAFTVDSNHLPKSSVSVFLRAAVPEIEKMLNADATCMDVDPVDHDNQMREEGAKAEQERVLKELIEHFEEVIREGQGITYNHPITYEWMYRGRVVNYLKSLRPGQKQERDSP